jgi:signal recognition particle GTPase
MADNWSAGDDLITAVTEAPTTQAAAAIVRAASPDAIEQACDTLYVDTAGHAAPWVRCHLVSEARA